MIVRISVHCRFYPFEDLIGLWVNHNFLFSKFQFIQFRLKPYNCLSIGFGHHELCNCFCAVDIFRQTNPSQHKLSVSIFSSHMSIHTVSKFDPKTGSLRTTFFCNPHFITLAHDFITSYQTYIKFEEMAVTIIFRF